MPASPSERRVACWLCSGIRSSTDLRARCRALLTELVVVPSASATSRAEKPSTSPQAQHRPLSGGEVLPRRDERQPGRRAKLIDRR